MDAHLDLAVADGGVDLDVAGLCTVRVEGATVAAVTAITRQLGASPLEASRVPDVTVRFGEDLIAPLTLAGPDAGYGADGFVLLRGPHRARVRVAVAFDRLGPHITLRCAGREGPVPHLLGLVNLSMIARGVLPLHASAFVTGGRTTLVTGWSKGGKTELLATVTATGSRYVGDEWIYVAPTGELHGLPEPVRLWRWQLRQLGRIAATLPRGDRVRLATVAAAARTARTVERWSGGASLPRRLAGVLEEQLSVRLPPEAVFGPRLPRAPAPDDLLLIRSAETTDYRLDATTVPDVIARAVASTAFEFTPLRDVYRTFRFCFPEDRYANDLLDDLERHLHALARDRLPRHAAAHLVTHPYPFDLARLHEVVAPVLSARGRAPTIVA
jgi:hypothetical protein